MQQEASLNQDDSEMPEQAQSQMQQQLDSLVSSVVQLKNLANKVPQNGESLLKIQNESDEQDQKNIKKRAQKTLNQLLSLIQYVQPEKQSQINALKQKPELLLKDLVSLQSRNYEDLIETVCDDLLENVNNQIDFHTKTKENPEKVPGAAAGNNNALKSEFFYQDKPRVDNTIKKSQLAWWGNIDNSYYPFIPSFDLKPHGKYPMPQELVKLRQDKLQNPLKYKQFKFGDHKLQKTNTSLPHPYSLEIEDIYNSIEQKDFPMPVIPQKYQIFEQTPFLFVETEEQLKEMHDHLAQQSEIAIDLEHHNYRSYQGFTCLMQISSRTRDFVVDTLKIRNLIGDSLRDIFDNENITKVLHGSDYDIEWLQKDFSLYVVNMFDTGQAARVLGLKGFGLAHLLQNYCLVIADKKYQLADWRQRPLPEEMLKYAREDTHYLLYIYDMMTQELIEKGLKANSENPFQFLRQVYHKSSALCLKTYEKPQAKDYNYYMIIGRNKTLQSLKQISALKMLLKWRDYIARIEDESASYIMPNHVLFQIGKDLPTTMNELKDCCRNNMSGIIMKYQDDLIKQIDIKLKSTKKGNTHIKFDEQKPVVSKSEIVAEAEEKHDHQSQLQFEEGKFPEYNIKINKKTAKSTIFNDKASFSKLQKKEKCKKSLEDQISHLSQIELFKTLSDNNELNITSSQQPSKPKKPIGIDEEKLQSLLGKRKHKESKVSDDENPVIRVVEEFIPAQKEKKVVIGKTMSLKEDDDALPKSIKEKYSKKSQKKHDEKKKEPKQEKQVVEEVKQQEKPVQEEQQQPKKKKDWSSIYGEGVQHIGNLMDKQQQMLEGEKKKKKKQFNKEKFGHKKGDKGNNKGGKPQQQGGDGKGKQQKKPKYYLGSNIGGDSKRGGF